MRRELPLPATLRRLGRRPAFLALAVTTLGLGIGAAAAMFAVVDAVLLRPLPYPQPERLVTVWNAELPARQGGSPLSLNEAVEYGEWARTLDGFAAFTWGQATLLGGDQARQLVCARVMQPLFPVLGLAPVLGRGFLPAEDAPGRDEAVVLSHALWRGAFGGDRQVLGRKVVLDGRPRVVVGVMPVGFDYPGHADLWVPLAIDRAALDAETIKSHGLNAVARLAPGVSLERAARDLDRVVGELAALYPGNYGPRDGVRLITLERTLVGGARTPLLSLLAAVGLLLLLACVNVATLLLLRAQERRRELAVRDALGASPWRLLGQLLGEALLLSLLAALLGLLGARASLAGVRVLLPADLARADALAIDWRVMGFAVAVAIATTLLVSTIPGWWLRRGRGAAALRGAARAPRTGRLPDALVVGQVALALVLSAGAALAGRSLGALSRVDVGFAPRGVLTARVALPEAAAYQTPEQVQAFWAALQQRLEADPRVAAVGAASWLPFADYPSDWGVEVDGYVPPPGAPKAGIEYTLTGGSYLRAMGARLIAGRTLRAGDERGLRKAVVTESFVGRFFAGKDPRGGDVLGRQLRLALDPAPYEIVGVVADQPLRGPDAPPRPGVFLPLVEIRTGTPFLPRGMTLVVRITGSAAERPEALAPVVRRAVRELDAQVPLADLRSFDAIWRQALGEPRSLFGVLALFAAVGLLVGGVGTFAVAAAWVVRGRREIGVRMALGAERRRVVLGVIGRGVRLTVAGCLLGSVVTVAAARAVRARLLFQVAPSDPAALGFAALVLLTVGLLATLVPARRAAAVQPMRVLREE
ncbi:MAG TPA: ADOP family duplicated permease [Thermoanaerobaculia bacterium]|jgi:predicted permease|nr:ADOP family duplicated permease [Thermoanaerobaculia bacterium]